MKLSDIQSNTRHRFSFLDMKMIFSLKLLFLCYTLVVYSHVCVHDSLSTTFQNSVNENTIKTIQPTLNISKEELHSRRLSDASALFEPLRIVFDTTKLDSDPGYMCTIQGEMVVMDTGKSYHCTREDVFTTAKKDMILNLLLPSIRNYFYSVLSVQRIQGSLRIPGLGCNSQATWACCSSAVPSNLKSIGIPNADYILHVTARPTSAGVIAWALPCNTDQYGRPVSGQANFGPSQIDVSSKARNEQIGTALHEMTHALVFSQNLFSSFRKPGNGDLWGLSNVIQREVVREIHVTKIITPKVVAEMKTHFQCFNWPNAGAELENEKGDSPSFSSHWEKRLFNNEYMTATSSYNPVYSALSLALFEDSGWYKADYAKAQLLPWGYQEGCSFARSSCKAWNSQYFCDTMNSQSCSADHNGKGYCDLTTYATSIPPGFEYFNNPAVGSHDIYADYCPTYRTYIDGDCLGIGQKDTYVDNSMGESVGLQSRCFLSTLDRSKAKGSPKPACYEIAHCSGSVLKLTIHGVTVTCPPEGGPIQVPGYQGTITCPPAKNLCRLLQTQCSGSGVYQSDGSCQCNPGFTGNDCSEFLCPQHQQRECSGTSGVCNRKTGLCECNSGFTGLDCSSRLCPMDALSKNKTECSGHGMCSRVNGTCKCSDGYSGSACECVPGCNSAPLSLRCNGIGSCSCQNGGCTCPHNFHGINCTLPNDPSIEDLYIGSNQTSINRHVQNKEYRFFQFWVNSSTYDFSIVLYSLSGDADLYASFRDKYPTALTPLTSLFSSTQSSNKDEVYFCGSYGKFPRGINDAFAYCSVPVQDYLQKTPGYLYVSVFGYSNATFRIFAQADKCSNESCGGHGTCGELYSGVCHCDRLWKGELCDLPSCRPDCLDEDIFCNWDVVTDTTQTKEKRIGIRSTTSCYGNGECEVVLDSYGKEIPTCSCDDTHYFSNPTKDQALCKELIPSIEYIQHQNGSFFVWADVAELKVKVDSWAVFTITVNSSHQMLYAILETLPGSEPSDGMLFIRKGKLPSLNVYPPIPIQFIDSSSYTSMLDTQKIILTRSTSTLSDGIYYIGVYNGKYGRQDLGYSLQVQVSENCTKDFCMGDGTCNVHSSAICTCTEAFSGDQCQNPVEYKDFLQVSPFSNDWETAALWDSQILEEGKWKYISFSIHDPTVAFARITLNVQSHSFSPRPLLLLREPALSGLPQLDRVATFDFDSVKNRSSQQQVIFPITKSCSGTDCYKLGIYNQNYGGGVLLYNVSIEFSSQRTNIFGSTHCDNISMPCHGRGQCMDSASGPFCNCYTGWEGYDCNVPTGFDLQQIQFAAKDIQLLCSTCKTSLFLKRGEMKLYRIPEPLKPNCGLFITVKAIDGGNPNIYVSEVLPRSLYDFTHIAANEGPVENLSLSQQSFSSQFWIAISSDVSTSTNTTLQFEIQSQLSFNTIDNQNSQEDDTLFGEAGRWLTSTAEGITIVIICSVFLFFILSYFLWKIFFSSETQDTELQRISHISGHQSTIENDEQEEKEEDISQNSPSKNGFSNILPSTMFSPSRTSPTKANTNFGLAENSCDNNSHSDINQV